MLPVCREFGIGGAFPGHIGVVFRDSPSIIDYDTWLADDNIDVLIFPTTVTKSSTSNTSNGRTPINSYSLPFLTVPMGILDTGEPTTLGIMGRHKADDEVLAVAAAYKGYTQKRIVSPLSPRLEGGTFSYWLLPPPTPPTPRPPAPVVVVPPSPLVTAPNFGQIVGRGRAASFGLTGIAITEAPVESVTLTVNGLRLPVTVEDGEWVSEVPLRRFKSLVIAVFAW